MKLAFRIIFRTFLFIGLFLTCYLISAFTLPYISSGNKQNNSSDSLTIFVVSNGVHTDILMPAKSKLKDWTLLFPKQNFNVTDSIRDHIAFGWGDKGFYLDTPEWSDLKFSTAFNAAFGLGETAMHVRYSRLPKEKEDECVAISISKKQYNDLINYIEKSFETKNDTVIKIDHPGYGKHDLFYEANGRYSLFKTCNIWANKALKKLGIKIGIWTPFSKGLMRSLN